MHLGLGLSLRDQRGSGGASAFAPYYITPPANRRMSINDTVVDPSTTTTIYIPPNATEVHFKVSYSSTDEASCWMRIAPLSYDHIGFSASDIDPLAETLHWRPGDDDDHWVTVTINTPNATPGNRFRLSIDGEGWGDTGVWIGLYVEIQNGAVNDAPTGTAPYHRPPKLFSENGASPTTELDISNIEITDTGYTGNAASGAGVWRGRHSHGYTQTGNSEVGAYINPYAYPLDAIEPVVPDVDTHGRDVLRFKSREFPAAVNIDGVDYFHQAPMIQGQRMAEWRHQTGVYRAKIAIPDRQGSWSAFWGLGCTVDGANLWPPEIDFFEAFNGAYGASYDPDDISNAQHVGDHGSVVRQMVSGLKMELASTGFDSGINLNTQIHDYLCLIEDQYIYHFLDGIEINCYLNMTAMGKLADDFCFYPVLNVAVRNPVSPFTSGKGEMLVYAVEYYSPSAGWTLSDYNTAKPWPDRQVTPGISMATDAVDVTGVAAYFDSTVSTSVIKDTDDVVTWGGQDSTTNAAHQATGANRPTGTLDGDLTDPTVLLTWPVIGGATLSGSDGSVVVATGGATWHALDYNIARVDSGDHMVCQIEYTAGTSGGVYVRNALNSTNGFEISGTIGSLAITQEQACTINSWSEVSLGSGRYRLTIDVDVAYTTDNNLRIGPNSTTSGENITFHSMQVWTNAGFIVGNEALTFTNADSEYLTLMDPLDTSSGCSGVAIIKPATGSANRPIVGGSADGSLTFRLNSSRQLEIERTGEATLLTGSTALTLGTSYIVAFRATDTNLQIYINGGTADATSATNPAFTQDSEYLGRSKTDYFDGQIGAVGLYTGHLSDADLNAVANYAATQFGLTWTDI